MNADEHLDRMLAELDANSAAEADSTVRDLHGELETLADDLRLPLPPDPHTEESAFRRAVELVREIGRNPSPDTLAAAVGQAFQPDPNGREATDAQEPPGQAGKPGLRDVGPYKLLAKLGQGGMGTVYKALHTRLEKVVALKVLPAERMTSPESVARFNREMKAVGKLEHPHIVRATDAGEADGTHYLVMEYVDGIDLAELLKRNGPLPVAAACELVRQAALGLQAAHSRGMVHRDVKPANLMLAVTPPQSPPWQGGDKGGVVKVLDLGLALLAETQTADSTGLTTDGHIMGTIDFMAPEQAGNSHAVDGRADIYSLGATLFALLTGESVFHGREFKTVMQKLSALATESASPIRDRRGDVPEELAAVVQRMLARNPAERFATPADVAAALQPFAEGAELSTLLAHAPKADGGTETATWDTRKVTASSSQETIRPTAGTARRSTERGRSASRRSVVIAAAMLGGLVLLAGILLSLRTKHGEVIVELGDDVPAEMAKQIKIEVRGNGDVKVADAAQGWTIDVKEGKYSVQLAGGGDRFQLDKQQVTVSRGNKTFIRVRLKPAGKGEPGALATRAKPWKPTAEQQAFFDAVTKMPAKKQVEAVRKKLMEVNPGFDGKVTHGIATGRVVSLSFLTDAVTEIWPVRGLSELERLICIGSAGGKGKLADLSPLQGMPLKELGCFSNANICNLSALTGMPLAFLNCNDTGVSDLSPLSGTCLTYLNCVRTRLSDLSPLKGMKLMVLRCNHTPVSDLSPLEGIKLTDLNLHGTRVSDLSPLKGMPLTHLNCAETRVSDLSPLKGMKLTHLNCSITQVSDLLPLEGMKLTDLNLHGTRVSDLSPLKGIPLTHLSCGGTRVSDLSPLKGMKLMVLQCLSTRVADLSPLKGMPLTHLECEHTRVSDLSPLKAMPLTLLHADFLRVSDLSPLKGMPLQTISFDRRLFHAPDETLLRSLPLKTIFDGHEWPSPGEFWKQFAARRQAAETFAAETAKLPADKQVAAVVALLKKLNENAVGTLGRIIENNAVTEATLVLTKETTDVTPLRAFTKLKKLTLTGGPYWLDISAVNSLPLEELTCSKDIALKNAPVLRGMKTLKTINGHPAGKYLDSVSPTPNAPVADAPGSPWKPTAEQQAFFDAVAKLPPEQQVEAVRKKLMEVNPGFDGKLTHKIDAGRVVELHFVTDEITAIWPVRALSNLQRLWCYGSLLGKGKLSNLTALKGMPLSYLHCHNSRVSDLSPLKGMKLTQLHCGGTRVSDLSPLKGMPLTVLACNVTRVSDLSPLKGMKLTALSCESTRVSDLSPLKDMPLSVLKCMRTGVSDLSPLKGMPLTYLNCSGTSVSDLSPLKGMPLTLLGLGNTRVFDLSIAKGMPLKSLGWDSTLVSDLSPIVDLPLEGIWCEPPLFQPIEETLLRKLPLKTVNLQPAAQYWKEFNVRRHAAETFAGESAKLPAQRQVAAVAEKLKQLNGDNVVRLGRVINNDAVTAATLVLAEKTKDVTPLRAFTRLKKLTLTGGPYWLDISAVNSLPLEELTCSKDIALRNAPVLRGMKTLQTINGQPAGKYLDSLTGAEKRKP